jgi:hypothetical protein
MELFERHPNYFAQDFASQPPFGRGHHDALQFDCALSSESPRRIT